MEKERIRELLVELDSTRKRFLQPRFLELGLTLGQGQPRILKKLYLAKEPMTQRELADACGFDVTTISRTLDRMEQAGLLERRKNPNCRRSFQIALTEAGGETAKMVTEAFAMADQVIWKGFSEEEMETLSEGLTRILENLKKEL